MSAADKTISGAELDSLTLEDRLWDVHGVVKATHARCLELPEELGIPVDMLEPIRRLCKVAADMLESLAADLNEAPALPAATGNAAGTEGGAA